MERENREESKTGLNEEYFNKMVELYEQRLNHLEEIIISMNSKTAQPAPIAINVNYPGEESKVVEVVPAIEPVEEEVQEAPVVVEEPEVSPVVVDSTFDTLTPSETAAVVDETMDGYAIKKGEVVPVVVPVKLTKEEKRLAKQQRKEEKRLAKEQRKEEKRLEKELIKKEKNLAKEEKKLAKQEKKLAKKKRHEEAAAVKAERERIKEERILNQERLKAEKELAKQRRKEEKLAKKAAKKQAKLDKKARKERKILEGQMAKASEEAYRLEKKKAKIERIRAKNDIATYNRAKRRAFWGFIKAIIIIAILIVIAALTITTLIDLDIIVGDFATYVNQFTTQYIPFMSPHGVVRVNVSMWVKQAIDFINGLFGAKPAE